MATHMSTAEFLKTPEFARLSPHQKMWLRSYLDSDNLIFAAYAAYPNVAEEHLRAFSYKVRRQKKIQAAMDRYFNRSKRDIFLDQLERDIKKSKGPAKIELQMRFAELKFGKQAKRKKS
jgi:hypothetical protein